MDIIKEIETEQLRKLVAERPVPDFGPGDTLRVNVKVVEGSRERVQAFEGVCIGRKNDGINSSFTVRKISYGEGVERVFPLHSPAIASIEVVRRGAVRRAKLYYLRGLRGKRARIAEKTDWDSTKTPAKDKTPEGETGVEAKAEKPKKKKGKKKAKVEEPGTGKGEKISAEAAAAKPAAKEKKADGADGDDEKAKKPAKKKATAAKGKDKGKKD